jgi:uracil-DNA glycosylase family 4
VKFIQEGPRDAKIVIVGEAPGTMEASTGRPFVGGSGELLNRMLSSTGISRGSCFITNLCHTQPPGNEFEHFIKPKPKPEFVIGVLKLKQDLEQIRPNLVIALGTQPLKVLTGKTGIDKWRGSILECTLVPGLKVIGTYHPAYILRQWDYKAVAEFDLRRCETQSTFPDILRPKRNLVLDPSREEFAGIESELFNAECLATDIECFETPGGWRLACIGFSPRPDLAVVLPWKDEWQKDAIRRLCASSIPKIFQNGNFDYTVLTDEYVPVNGFGELGPDKYTPVGWDTMLAHHSIFPECASGGDEMAALGGKKKQSAIAKGLAFLTSIYTEEPFYKDDGKLWKETNDLTMFYRYNALDCVVTKEVQEVEEKELKEFGTFSTFVREMRLVRPTVTTMKRGIKIDLMLREKLKKNFEQEIINLQLALDKSAGSPINVKSSLQVKSLLYDKLKLPAKRSRTTGNETANKDAIIELAERHNHPILHTILAIRQRRDFIERYLEAKVDADGRMRCSFDITGTRTGRLSSRASIYGSGTNLQNIPVRRPEGEAIRRMFVADPGKVFVGRDFSQAEARIVALLARSEALISLFSDPTRDVHTENASRIFGRQTIQLVSDGGDVLPEERYLAKRVIHASNYGMEAPRLVQIVNEDAPYTQVRIDLGTARRLLDAYFMLYPEIRNVFWADVERELKYSRTLVNPFGRKRQFFGRWDDKLLREAYAHIPQSTVGDMGGIAMADCYWRIEQPEGDLHIPGADLMLQVHDSVYMQCFPQDVERVADAMAQVMNLPVSMNDYTITIPTDCKVGCNLASRPKKTPEENPQGLIDLSKWLKERAA